MVTAIQWFIFFGVLAPAGLAVVAVLAIFHSRHTRHIRRRSRLRSFARERRARLLHDDLVQDVQGLLLSFDAAARQVPSTDRARLLLDNTLDTADGVLIRARDRSAALRPCFPRGMDLARALSRTVRRWRRAPRPSLKVIVEGHERPLRADVRDEIIIVGQHAVLAWLGTGRPGHLEVDILHGRHVLRVRIRHDMGGRDVDFGMNDHDLIEMRKRIDSIGGRLKVWSRLGAGSEIDIEVDSAAAYMRLTAPRRPHWLWPDFRGKTHVES